MTSLPLPPRDLAQLVQSGGRLRVARGAAVQEHIMRRTASSPRSSRQVSPVERFKSDQRAELIRRLVVGG